MKNKKIITFICLASILIIMAITNPSKADYIEWCKQSIQAITNNGYKGVAGLISEPAIENATTVKNYVFLSHFTTEFNNNSFDTVGMFGNFIDNGKTAMLVYLLLIGTLITLVTILIL